MKDLTQFNAGGSHAENPNGGIQQGVGANGKINTVEQGETKQGNYVYSDSLKTPVKLINKFKLPKYLAGKTFAEATKLLDKRFEDRHDNASNRTKETFLNRLKEAQEYHKVELEARDLGLTVPEYEDIKASQQQEQGNEFFAGGVMSGASSILESSLKNKEGGLTEEGVASETNPLGAAASGAMKGAAAGAPLGAVGMGAGAIIGGVLEGGSALLGNKESIKMEGDFTRENAAMKTQQLEGEALPEDKTVGEESFKTNSPGFNVGEMISNTMAIANGAATSGMGFDIPETRGLDMDMGGGQAPEAMDISKLKLQPRKYGGSLNQLEEGGNTFDPKDLLPPKGGLVQSMRELMSKKVSLNDIKGIFQRDSEGKIVPPNYYNQYNPFMDLPWYGRGEFDGGFRGGGYGGAGATSDFQMPEDFEPEWSPEDTNIDDIIANIPEATTPTPERNVPRMNIDNIGTDPVTGLQRAMTPEIGAQGSKDILPEDSNIASDILGYGALATSLAPFVGNLIEGNNLEQADPDRYVRAGRTYIPEFADERRLLNIVDDSYAGTEQAIANATSGNLGAYRSGIRGVGTQRNKARMEAYGNIEEINRRERRAMNDDYAAAVKEDAKLSNQEKLDKAQDLAAFEDARGAYRKAAYEGLGELGKTIFQTNQQVGLTSYDFVTGKKKKDGEGK